MESQRIEFVHPLTKESLLEIEGGVKSKKGEVFPYKNGAIRFVEDINYASNFGYQWNRFEKTQLDLFQKNLSQSTERFRRVTEWDKENLDDKKILEAGCGAGRFTQAALKYTSAEIYSFDYSNSVEANYRNNGNSKRLHLFQASIYDIPLPKKSFDKVFCFGVIQFTPDPRKSVDSLLEMAKPGGEVIIDFFPYKGWYTKFHAKYFARIFTRRMSNERLINWIDDNIDWMINWSMKLGKLGILGKILNRFIPVCDINTTFPDNLPEEHIREWAMLDTFNMLSPAYDKPQKLGDIKSWFEQAGFEVKFAGYIPYGEKNYVSVVKGIAP